MCGLFGMIGQHDPWLIRALAVANESRGRHALGMYSETTLVKKAGVPTTLLSGDTFDDVISQPVPILAGHTRLGTRGPSASDDCAHPFVFDHIKGAHNGCVWAPKEYEVDSQVIFDNLAEFDKLSEALTGVSGSIALAWFDLNKETFSLYSNGRSPLAICDLSVGYAYSSDIRHLTACTGLPCESLEKDHCIVFDLHGKMIDRFEVKVPPVIYKAQEKDNGANASAVVYSPSVKPPTPNGGYGPRTGQSLIDDATQAVLDHPDDLDEEAWVERYGDKSREDMERELQEMEDYYGSREDDSEDSETDTVINANWTILHDRLDDILFDNDEALQVLLDLEQAGFSAIDIEDQFTIEDLAAVLSIADVPLRAERTF